MALKQEETMNLFFQFLPRERDEPTTTPVSVWRHRAEARQLYMFFRSW
jgi:hypothetical protein